MCSVFEVADYFLAKAEQSEKTHLRGISNKKLQKLVYYAQVWMQALQKRLFFTENLEAWLHGPVVPQLYDKLKHFGYNPIVNIKLSDSTYHFSSKEIELLDEIWRVYGKFDADYLEMLTHNEEPWQIARVGLEAGQYSNRVIDVEKAGIYYLDRLKNANQKEKSRNTDG